MNSRRAFPAPVLLATLAFAQDPAFKLTVDQQMPRELYRLGQNICVAKWKSKASVKQMKPRTILIWL